MPGKDWTLKLPDCLWKYVFSCCFPQIPKKGTTHIPVSSEGRRCMGGGGLPYVYIYIYISMYVYTYIYIYKYTYVPTYVKVETPPIKGTCSSPIHIYIYIYNSTCYKRNFSSLPRAFRGCRQLSARGRGGCSIGSSVRVPRGHPEVWWGVVVRKVF